MSFPGHERIRDAAVISLLGERYILCDPQGKETLRGYLRVDSCRWHLALMISSVCIFTKLLPSILAVSPPE